MNTKLNGKKKVSLKIRIRRWFLDLMKRTNEENHRNDWITLWVDELTDLPYSVRSLLDLMAKLFCGAIVMSIILTLYVYLMVYKELVFKFIVQMMVDEAIKYNATFSEVYTAFGIAILICGYFLCTAILMMSRWQPKENLARGIGEIVYLLKHKPSPEKSIVDPVGEAAAEPM
jgi:hypothetical protein